MSVAMTRAPESSGRTTSPGDAGAVSWDEITDGPDLSQLRTVDVVLPAALLAAVLLPLDRVCSARLAEG